MKMYFYFKRTLFLVFLIVFLFEFNANAQEPVTDIAISVTNTNMFVAPNSSINLTFIITVENRGPDINPTNGEIYLERVDMNNATSGVGGNYCFFWDNVITNDPFSYANYPPLDVYVRYTCTVDLTIWPKVTDEYFDLTVSATFPYIDPNIENNSTTIRIPLKTTPSSIPTMSSLGVFILTLLLLLTLLRTFAINKKDNKTTN